MDLMNYFSMQTYIDSDTGLWIDLDIPFTPANFRDALLEMIEFNELKYDLNLPLC